MNLELITEGYKSVQEWGKWLVTIETTICAALWPKLSETPPRPLRFTWARPCSWARLSHHHLAGYGLILHKTLPYPRRERRQVGARADDHPIRLLFYWNRLLWGARF